jgi:hypothetical protein
MPPYPTFATSYSPTPAPSDDGTSSGVGLVLFFIFFGVAAVYCYRRLKTPKQQQNTNQEVEQLGAHRFKNLAEEKSDNLVNAQ